VIARIYMSGAVDTSIVLTDAFYFPNVFTSVVSVDAGSSFYLSGARFQSSDAGTTTPQATGVSGEGGGGLRLLTGLTSTKTALLARAAPFKALELHGANSSYNLVAAISCGIEQPFCFAGVTTVGESWNSALLPTSASNTYVDVIGYGVSATAVGQICQSLRQNDSVIWLADCGAVRYALLARCCSGSLHATCAPICRSGAFDAVSCVHRLALLPDAFLLGSNDTAWMLNSTYGFPLGEVGCRSIAGMPVAGTCSIPRTRLLYIKPTFDTGTGDFMLFVVAEPRPGVPASQSNVYAGIAGTRTEMWSQIAVSFSNTLWKASWTCCMISHWQTTVIQLYAQSVAAGSFNVVQTPTPTAGLTPSPSYSSGMSAPACSLLATCRHCLGLYSYAGASHYATASVTETASITPSAVPADANNVFAVRIVS
jgi:hypothetical protein